MLSCVIIQWLTQEPDSDKRLTVKISYANLVFCCIDCLIGIVVKVSTSRAEDPGFKSACTGIFPGSSHTSDLKIGTPVATLPGACQGQCWGWLDWYQYTVTRWDWKLDLQLLSQCGCMHSCLSRSIPEIHSHVAGTLTNQQTNCCVAVELLSGGMVWNECFIPWLFNARLASTGQQWTDSGVCGARQQHWFWTVHVQRHWWHLNYKQDVWSFGC